MTEEFTELDQLQLKVTAQEIRLLIKDHHALSLQMKIIEGQVNGLNAELKAKAESMMKSQGLSLDEYKWIRDENTGIFEIVKKPEIKSAKESIAREGKI